MPRPRSLTHTGIATAALSVIDAHGLAALTMRAVATELGMGTMSLYRYVADREELEGLVVDLVLGNVDVSTPNRAPWKERVTLLFGRVRAAVGAHPATVPLLLTRRDTSASLLRFGECALAILTDGGFSGERRAVAFRCLNSYVLGALQIAHLGPLSGEGTAALAELPRTEFPLLASTAQDAKNLTADEEFRSGLAAVLDGLDGLVAGPPGDARSPAAEDADAGDARREHR